MIFVDTGAFLGLYEKRDQHHAAAARLWKELKEPLSTSNHVVDEVATYLGRRVGFSEAADRVDDLYHSLTIQIIASTRDDELDALGWMREYSDQGIGFTDCVSFAIMRRHRIRTAFTFDRHFHHAGFSVVGLR